MGLKKMMVVAVVALSAQAFASSRVEEALSMNAAPAKKATDKNKAPKAKVFDTLNTTSETQKTDLPKNARHDATAGVFI